MSNKNNFWSITIVYSVGFLSLRAISFLLLPLYTNLLTTKEAGYVFILYTILAFLNTLYNHGMDSSLLKFYNPKHSKKIISTSIIYSIIYGFILSGILFFFLIIGDNPLLGYFREVVWYFEIHEIAQLLLCILFCDMLSSRLMTIIRLLEKPFYFLLVSFVNVGFSLYLNIYFIKILNMGFGGALLSMVGVSMIQLLLLSPLIIMNLKFTLFDYDLLKKMVVFSIPFLPASIFFIMIEMADRLMLGWLSSVENVGLYGAGYKIGAIILLVVRAFNLNWQPFYLKEKHENNVQAFKNIGERFIVILIFISTLISMLWLLLFQVNINGTFLIGKEFWGGGSIIPVIALSYLIYGVFILQMPSIYIKNKQNWVPYFWGLGFVVNIIMNYTLIPIYGFYGAAISTLSSYLAMTIFLIYKNQEWLPIKYKLNDIIYIATISIIALYCHNQGIVYLPILFIIYSTLSIIKIIAMKKTI